MNLKERARRLKSDIPAVYLALLDSSTPVSAKMLAAFAVAYALSPIDLIPDFIPVIGYLDDLLILPLLVAWTIRLIPPETMARCRARAEGLWSGGKTKKWYYAVPIIAVWLLIAALILKLALR